METEQLEVDVPTARKLLQEGAILLDIREWEEVEMMTFDVEEMIWLPQSLLSEQYSGIPVDKTVILGCHSGRRSLEATLFLKNRGFQTVYSLQGGISDWMSFDYPVKWDNNIEEDVLHLHGMDEVTENE